MSTIEQNQHKSKDEILELIRRCQIDASEEAQTRLVEHYEQLVRSLAMKFSGRFENEDLFQASLLGIDLRFQIYLKTKIYSK